LQAQSKLAIAEVAAGGTTRLSEQEALAETER
jgi:hypothetical protein